VKIVHIFKDFYPPLAAGITCYLADVSDELARRGHQVDVHVAGVRHSRRDRLASSVVVHRHRELARVLSMPISPGLVREMRGIEADVVHVHMPNPIGELGALLSKSPLVCTFHAQLVRQKALEPLYGPMRTKLLRRATSVLVSSAAMTKVPELAPVAGNVEILPFGVSPRLISPVRVNRVSSEVLRLLFVGRLVYYKGLDVLLRAVALVEDVTLDVVGEGPERHALESLTDELGIRKRVSFRGYVDDDALRETYGTADVFVLPSSSRAEAFGMAMSEAMANGLPAISTALRTGTDWVNVDAVTGLVVPAGDSRALADAVERLRDPHLRHVLAMGARDRADALFGFASHVDELERVYREAAR